MNTVLKVFLSMSFSGALLILVLFAGKRLIKNKISRQWQYYIWLIVIARLLLPFGSERNLMGKTYQIIDQTITQSFFLLQQQNYTTDILDDFEIELEPNNQNKSQSMDNQTESFTTTETSLFYKIHKIYSFLIHNLWLVWLVVALLLLTRKITIYQSFVRYVNVGLNPISDTNLFDRLFVIAKQIGNKKPIELGVNPLISSPLLIGFFHPCIVLPSTDISEKDFHYIILHELLHERRKDMFYKWLVQITVCLHWFNPLVYFMSSEITKACEFSCDEAVLVKIGYHSAQEYGKTLLDAMAAVGSYKESFGAVTLSKNKQLLKERLGVIMSCKKKSKAIWLLTGILTLGIIFGAFFVGVYPVVASVHSNSLEESNFSVTNRKRTDVTQAEESYQNGNLPLFQMAFSQMDEKTQGEWLDRIYTDGEIAFFSVSVDQLEEDSFLIQFFAEKAYMDHSISFFSVLANRISEEKLELWAERARKDQRINFQMVLFEELEWYDKQEDLEEELEAQQQEEYRLYDIICDGKSYYYKGQLVQIFLDIRQDSSFYTLDINRQGIINIKITRNKKGEIESINEMTWEEAEEFLKEMED